MGFMDELKKLARPYAEDDEDDYDDYDNDDFEDEEDEAPEPAPVPAALPRPSVHQNPAAQRSPAAAARSSMCIPRPSCRSFWSSRSGLTMSLRSQSTCGSAAPLF